VQAKAFGYQVVEHRAQHGNQSGLPAFQQHPGLLVLLGEAVGVQPLGCPEPQAG
jgi:hypothetical protein